MRLSARNQLHGEIVDIEEGSVNGLVTIRLAGSEHTVTSSITMRSINELGLKVGGSATAVIKSSDVIVGVE